MKGNKISCVQRLNLKLWLFAVVAFAAGFLSGGYSKSSIKFIETGNAPLIRSATKENADRKDYDEGWHPIHIFYGDDKFLKPREKSVLSKSKKEGSFSQVGQDLAVLEMFENKKGRNRFFVDLAANDAIRFSNTLKLEKSGWDGICIEPNPKYWRDLAHRKCQVVAAAVGAELKTDVKFKFDGVFGGIVGANFDNTEDSSKVSVPSVHLYTVPLQHIFEKFGAPKIIDYFSLDVEGAETYIMKTFPFDKYKFNVLTVERPDDDLKKILNKNGYKEIKSLSSWGETLWARTAFLEGNDKN